MCFDNMEGCLISHERPETFSYPHVNVVHFHEHTVQKKNHRMFRYSSGKFDNSSEGQTIYRSFEFEYLKPTKEGAHFTNLCSSLV